MNEVELYIKNEYEKTNPEAYKYYKFILDLINKILVNKIIENGGFDVDQERNMTKKLDDLQFTIHGYQYNEGEKTIGAEIVLYPKSKNPRSVQILIDTETLKRDGVNWNAKYDESPVRFYMEKSNPELGTLSLQDKYLFYFDAKSYEEYLKSVEGKDTNPTNRDYVNSGLSCNNKLQLKYFTLAQMCRHVHSILEYGFNAPVVESTINKEAGLKKK